MAYKFLTVIWAREKKKIVIELAVSAGQPFTIDISTR